MTIIIHILIGIPFVAAALFGFFAWGYTRGSNYHPYDPLAAEHEAMKRARGNGSLAGTITEAMEKEKEREIAFRYRR
jgi:hypothetical protein